MKSLKYISALVMVVLFVSSCELELGETYNNDYAQEWFKATDNVVQQTWDIVRLDLSDRSFEISEATLDIDANLSEYKGTSKGSITQSYSTTLRMTVEEIYVNGEWYSRADYITLQEALGQSSTEAAVLADKHYITTTINYSISNNPATLTVAGGSEEINGNYYGSVMASVIND